MKPKTQKNNQKRPTALPPATGYAKYTDYIKNAGGKPTVQWFDDDWSPIGPQVRREMEAAGLIREIEGRLYLA